MYIWLINQILNYHLSALKNPNQIDHLGRANRNFKSCSDSTSSAGPLPTLKSVKRTINYLKLVKMVKMLVKYYLKWW